MAKSKNRRKHKPLVPKEDFKKRAIKRVARAAVISGTFFALGLGIEASYAVYSHFFMKVGELSLGAVMEFVLFGWE